MNRDDLAFILAFLVFVGGVIVIFFGIAQFGYWLAAPPIVECPKFSFDQYVGGAWRCVETIPPISIKERPTFFWTQPSQTTEAIQ